MSASWQRVLGLMVVSASLVVGCGPARKIDVGGSCVLNSDCNQGLVCTWGKCHVACHTSADCQPGQSCIIASAQSTVCESPTGCIYNSDCPTGLICAVDQQCRKQCQTNADCTSGQTCTSTQTCAELRQVDSNNNLFLPDGGVSGSGGASGAGDAASCPTGAETCSCYGNDTCNAGLICASHLCVSLGTGGSGGGSGSGAGVPDAAPGAQSDVPIGGTGGGGGAAGTGGSNSPNPDASALLAADVPGSTGGLPDARRTQPDVAISGSPADGGATKLLLHMDGANGGTTFLDSSYSAHTMTATGATTTSTAQSVFGGASFYSGANHTGALTTGTSPDWNFGVGSFTVEGWIYTTDNTQTQRLVAAGSELDGAYHLWGFGYGRNSAWGDGTDPALDFFYLAPGGWVDLAVNVPIPNNTWHHIAAVRSGTSLYLFLDGTMVQTFAVPSDLSLNGGTSHGLVVGARWYNGSLFEFAFGYQDEVRVSNGIARWTSNFTVSTSPYGPTD